MTGNLESPGNFIHAFEATRYNSEPSTASNDCDIRDYPNRLPGFGMTFGWVIREAVALDGCPSRLPRRSPAMEEANVEFTDLLARVRAHDKEAITSLLQRFEEDVRIMVRVRLPRALRNQFDSMDFVQAVWQSVLVHKGDDVGEFEDPGKFRGFLAAVARNKVFEEHRRRSTLKYDLGREERLYVRKGEREIPREVRAADPTPSETVQAGERLGQLIQGRSDHEKQVVELRRQGLTFDEIARQLGRDERSIRRVIDDIRRRMEERQWQ